MKHTAATTSSHQRYRAFVNDYRQRRIDDADKTEHQSINPVASGEVIVDKRRKISERRPGNGCDRIATALLC